MRLLFSIFLCLSFVFLQGQTRISEVNRGLKGKSSTAQIDYLLNWAQLKSSSRPSDASHVAKVAYDKAKKRYTKYNDRNSRAKMAEALHLRGVIAFREGNFKRNDNVFDLLKRSNTIADQIGDRDLITENTMILYSAAMANNQTSQARNYMNKVLGSKSTRPRTSTSSSGSSRREKEALEKSKRLERENSKLKRENSELVTENLTLKNETSTYKNLGIESQEKLAELDKLTKEELKAKQKELEKATKDKYSLIKESDLKLKDSKMRRLEVEARLNSETARRDRWFFIGGGLMLLLGTLAMVFWNRNRLKQKSNLALQKKNDEIQEQNNEIQKQKERLQENNRAIQLQKRHLENQRDEILVKSREIANQRDEIVKQKEAQERILIDLQATQTQLVESEKMASLGQLTAGIAHEINNPINFVTGNISPLKRDIEDIVSMFEKFQGLAKSPNVESDLKEALDYCEDLESDFIFEEVFNLVNGIEEGALRTKDIVQGLRNFSRTDEEDFKRADIEDGIDSTLMLLKNNLKDRVKIIRHYGEVGEIDCLPGKLNQVFMNILNNAGQAIEGPGEINITTAKINDQQVQISIKDSGKGMTEETKKRLFEPFFTTKDVGEGTGLGLSITYGIIEKHNGKIDVESALGEGTTFMITLPIDQPKAEEEKEA